MKVSIIVTNYNKSKWLGRSIRSAMSQHFSKDDYEVIVVDDCSTNGSRAMLESFGSSDGLRVIFLPENTGLPAAINTGIRKANGMYVTRLDADDIFMRDIIYTLCLALDHNKDCGYAWCDHYLIDEEENIIGRSSAKLGCAIMFRKSLLEDIGLYDEEFRVMEEKELMVRLNKREVKGVHIPIPLYKYRQLNDSLSHSKEAAKYVNKINEKHFYKGGSSIDQ